MKRDLNSISITVTIYNDQISILHIDSLMMLMAWDTIMNVTFSCYSFFVCFSTWQHLEQRSRKRVWIGVARVFNIEHYRMHNLACVRGNFYRPLPRQRYRSCWVVLHIHIHFSIIVFLVKGSLTTFLPIIIFYTLTPSFCCLMVDVVFSFSSFLLLLFACLLAFFFSLFWPFWRLMRQHPSTPLNDWVSPKQNTRCVAFVIEGETV